MKGNLWDGVKKHTFKNDCNIIKKIIFVFLLFTILAINTVSYANIDEHEIIDINEIKKETIETVAKTTEEPKLNARVGLIFDRNSKTILYEKNGGKTMIKQEVTIKNLDTSFVSGLVNTAEKFRAQAATAGSGSSATPSTCGATPFRWDSSQHSYSNCRSCGCTSCYARMNS